MEWECHECGHHHAAVPAACEACGTKPEIRFNVWRCEHCGAEGILAAATRCPVCGVEHKAGVATAVDVSARVEGEQARKLADGAWRYCAYCDAQVPPVDDAGKPNEDCPNCRGPLSEATREAAVEEVSAEEAGKYRTEATHDPTKRAPPRAAAPPPKKRRVWPWIVFPALIVVVGIVAFVALRGPSSFVVSGKRWVHELAVEAFGPVQDSCWGTPPPGARNRTCTREIHHHDRVPRGTETYTDRVADGRRCASYGYRKKGGVSVKSCTRWETTYRTVRKRRTRYVQVPVFRRRCRYTVDRWHPERTIKLEGGDADAPRWPAEGGELRRGERAGTRKATYTLLLKAPKGDETKPYTCRDLGEYQRFALQTPVLADVSIIGTVKSVAPAQ